MDFLAEIWQILPKIIFFWPQINHFYNFKKPTTGQYSVVRGATLDTHIDMFKKNWKIEQFLLRVGNLKKIKVSQGYL